MLATACATSPSGAPAPTTSSTTTAPSGTTTTATLPITTTTTSTTTTTTAPGGFVAGPLVAKHCTVGPDGCTVANPGRDDVTLAAPTPAPVPARPALAYGPLPAHVLDVYLPTDGADEILVYFHAGGWTAGDRRDVPATVLRQLEHHRAVVSVDYRLAPDAPWPAQMHDADRAIRWIRVHAADWGIGAVPIVAVGASAGGHLALFAAAAPAHLVDPTLPAALRAVDPRLSGVVALAAPADIGSILHHDWGPALLQALLGCSFDCSPATLADASPSTHLGTTAPPAYLAVGALDSLVPPDVNLVALAAAWRTATSPRNVWVDLVDDRSHNIDIDGVNAAALDEFLAAAVRR